MRRVDWWPIAVERSMVAPLAIGSPPASEIAGAVQLSPCAATGLDEVIVVEGFFDCLRVHQAGFPCVVALMGVTCSERQRELLAGTFPRVVLLLDGDAAGRAASGRIAKNLRPVSAVTEVLLERGVQPDQMPVDEIRQLLAGAERRQRIGTN